MMSEEQEIIDQGVIALQSKPEGRHSFMSYYIAKTSDQLQALAVSVDTRWLLTTRDADQHAPTLCATEIWGTSVIDYVVISRKQHFFLLTLQQNE